MTAVPWRWLAVVLLAWAAGAFAQATQVAVPAATSHVIDQTSTLTPAQAAALEGRLAEFERTHGAQVVVLIVPTTAPETIEAYGIRVAEQWRIGRKGADDGVIVLLALQDRAARIEVGYGLEGVLPDATAHRILAEDMAPRLRAGDIAGGIEAGVDRILSVVGVEPAAPAPGGDDEGATTVLLTVSMVAAAVGGLLRRWLGRPRAAAATAAAAGALAGWLSGSWSVAALAGAIAAVAVSTGLLGWLPWTSRSGGSSFRGGGGGFGGGGASGRW